jgi:hypothetical protein
MKMSSRKSTSNKRQQKPEAKDDGLDIPVNLRREPVPPAQKKSETTTIAKPTDTPAPTETPKKVKPPVKIKEAKKAKSMSRAIKDFLVREPRMPLDELVAKLNNAGFKGRSVVTIQTLRSDTLTTLAAARDAGLYAVEME